MISNHDQYSPLPHTEVRFLLQEMKFHGISMAGPVKEMQAAAKGGRYKSNVQRDILRKVQNVAS